MPKPRLGRGSCGCKPQGTLPASHSLLIPRGGLAGSAVVRPRFVAGRVRSLGMTTASSTEAHPESRGHSPGRQEGRLDIGADKEREPHLGTY